MAKNKFKVDELGLNKPISQVSDDAQYFLDKQQGKFDSKYNFIQADWNGFNILHLAAARVGGLDIGFMPGKSGYNVQQILNNAEKNKINMLNFKANRFTNK
jgi:NADH-quinone oxidoreductase subunit G